MAFAERCEKLIKEMRTEELTELLSGGFAFEKELGGQSCAVRRMRDMIMGKDQLETDLFIYPKTGEKKQQLQGVVLTFDSEVEDILSPQLVYKTISLTGLRRPQVPEIYYAHVAATGGKTIAESGITNFLHHVIEITTPEKEVIALEDFDFSKHKLFMLGLYGGEYQIGVVRRTE